jgi:hypothetical protein
MNSFIQALCTVNRCKVGAHAQIRDNRFYDTERNYVVCFRPEEILGPIRVMCSGDPN